MLDLFFEDAIEFFFPQAHAQIDWARGYEFLDKELQKITADAAIGRRVVDKLVKVWLKTGEELWVSLHIEVQGQREADFELRIYIYNFRAFDRFNVPVATFVILTDEEKSWRPEAHVRELLGTELRFKFSAVKLTDYEARWEELEQSQSLFSIVVQAHLTALRTRDNARERLQSRWQLTRRLLECGFDKRVIIGLYRFLDWVLTLPDELAGEFQDKLTEYEEERKMKYVTSFERHGIQKGIEQGILIGLRKGTAEIVLRQLQRRFGPLDAAVQTHIQALPVEQIEELSDALLDFAMRADLEVWLQQHPLPSRAKYEAALAEVQDVEPEPYDNLSEP